jgi:renal tumor antigen
MLLPAVHLSSATTAARHADYRLLHKKGEGTFSEVLKAQCIHTNRMVAIKVMKNRFESIDQVNNLREIQALERLRPSPHIVTLLDTKL